MGLDRNYESDHAKWMREWLEKHPQEVQEQQTGRALWWDKPPQSLDAQQRTAETKVPDKAYYYDVN